MKRIAIIFLAGCLCLSAGTAWAFFESKKELVNSSKVTMAEAIDAAVKAVPGKAVEAEIDTEHDRTVFEVEVIDAAGKTQEVYIDAQTGESFKIEAD
ncbi:PepSY domain-containing protein [Nitrospira sp. M1]